MYKARAQKPSVPKLNDVQKAVNSKDESAEPSEAGKPRCFCGHEPDVGRGAYLGRIQLAILLAILDHLRWHGFGAVVLYM